MPEPGTSTTEAGNMSAPKSTQAQELARILLVEDEPGLVLTLVDRLSSEGYTVDTVADGNEAEACAMNGRYDLVILDLMLPHKSGFDICRDLRREGFGAPILMLTARSQITDKVVGLKLGADDYLTKPFEMIELLARVEALLRRSSSSVSGTAERYRFADVQVDFRSAEVHKDGKAVELSAKEFQLLRHFIQHRGAALSRNELLDQVWGYNSMPTTRTVDVHVAWLRQKIETNPRRPQFILTVHGLGYKFVG